MPLNASSDQGVHYLITKCSIKIWKKWEKKHPTTNLTEMDWSNLEEWEILFALKGLISGQQTVILMHLQM